MKVPDVRLFYLISHSLRPGTESSGASVEYTRKVSVILLNIAVKLASLGSQSLVYEQQSCNYGFRGGRCTTQKTVGATSVR